MRPYVTVTSESKRSTLSFLDDHEDGSVNNWLRCIQEVLDGWPLNGYEMLASDKGIYTMIDV